MVGAGNLLKQEREELKAKANIVYYDKTVPQQDMVDPLQLPQLKQESPIQQPIHQPLQSMQQQSVQHPLQQPQQSLKQQLHQLQPLHEQQVHIEHSPPKADSNSVVVAGTNVFFRSDNSSII